MADLGTVPCDACGEPLQVTAHAVTTVGGKKAWVRVHVDQCECGWTNDAPTLPEGEAS